MKENIFDPYFNPRLAGGKGKTTSKHGRTNDPNEKYRAMMERNFAARSLLTLALSLSAQGISYDVVLVGCGTAGITVLKEIVAAKHPNLRVAVLEFGGPLSRTMGGDDWAPAFKNLTIFDIPGEYENFAGLGYGQK
jgi:hypothetical protein